mmetsp:Transcript_1417/g.2945  ORF Transcript_1417/g.2945 Transcript_1417/m.2945 type:complete len:280 (+) Transcript_1417:420-1259(+)
MSFLGHFRSCRQSGSDRPDGFVRNGNLVPVRYGQAFRQWLQLLGTDFHGDSTLAFFLLFANRKHDLEAVVNGGLALLGAEILGFPGHSKTRPAFRVTDNHPGTAHGRELVGASFSRVGSVSGVEPAVLGSDSNVPAKAAQQERNIHKRDTQGDLDIFGNGTRFVEHFDAGQILVPGTVALPVSTNQVLALRGDETGWLRRSHGAMSLEGIGWPKEFRDGSINLCDAPRRVNRVQGSSSRLETFDDREAGCNVGLESLSNDLDRVVRSSRILGAFQQASD